MKAEYDAILFDAGGVFVIPDPAVLAPTLAYYGATLDHDQYHRAHYGAMAAKSRAQVTEDDWSHYNRRYVELVGVHPDEHDSAVYVLSRTRHAHLWRAPIAGSSQVLRALNQRGTPIGVVSNASGQVEEILQRSGICQVGEGPLPQVRCIVDSDVVGVAKPDPKIFDFALPYFAGIEKSRIAYVGDSVVMDIGGAHAAGLTPILVDPYDDAVDLVDCRRISTLEELL
ncbi:MAG: HAD hydrolase-like protein [Actinobacteria bacterium]|nr:HAD hydrolase-like protein [Actinomycetota bacterium]